MALKELPASADCWEAHHKERGFALLDQANQHLDEKGDERRQLFRNCAEELQKLNPKNEIEALQMIRIALYYYQVLSEPLYRHPPSAAQKIKAFTEELLNKVKASPSKTELQKQFETLQEGARARDQETRKGLLKLSP